MKISKVKNVKTPARGTGRSAGIDFFVPADFEEIDLAPGHSVKIASGVRVEVPTGFALIAFNKSGVALSGLQVGACVVDEDYQGEINLHVFNTFNATSETIKIKPNQKLVQFILIPVSYER
jgi:dUTP pyrophosphatase